MLSRTNSHHVHFPFITLQLLDKMRTIFGDFPEIQCVWIFGMHALWTAKPASDIEIAVSGIFDEKRLLQINSILQQKLSISRKTPCIHYENMATLLKQHIDNEGIKIYDIDEVFSDPHAKQKKKKITLS